MAQTEDLNFDFDDFSQTYPDAAAHLVLAKELYDRGQRHGRLGQVEISKSIACLSGCKAILRQLQEEHENAYAVLATANVELEEVGN